MTRVYIVERWIKGRGFEIEGAYSSEAKAESIRREEIEKIDPMLLWGHEWVEVNEWEVDVEEQEKPLIASDILARVPPPILNDKLMEALVAKVEEIMKGHGKS